MANIGLNTAQALPRFLLPRLSWQTASARNHTIRALSTATSTYNVPSRPLNVAESRVIRRRDNGPARPKTSILQNPSHHRAFHATARQARDHHFDTLKFVQRLQEEGFTEAQSVAMMKVLSDVIEERFVPFSSFSELLSSGERILAGES
jgi:predicted DsbA family dithiol-disulfide isomerase